MALPAAAADGVPDPPVNVEVAAVTTDSITLVWGPTQPGAFTASNGTNNAVTVGWSASEDPRGPLSYEVARDGQVVASGVTGTGSPSAASSPSSSGSPTPAPPAPIWLARTAIAARTTSTVSGAPPPPAWLRTSRHW